MKKPTQDDLARWGRAWEALRHSDADFAPDVLELLDMMYDQWTMASSFARNEEVLKDQERKKGGSKTKYAAVHELAEKLWRGDPTQTKKEVARQVVDLANKSPEEFGLKKGDVVKEDTVDRRLWKIK